jgi:hypothetical protein
MTRPFFALLRTALCLALLPFAAVAAPPLLVPHEGPVAKAEGPRPFKSEGRRVHFNLHGLQDLRPGDEVELRLPDGKVHALVFDVLKDEGNGIVTWVGHHKGSTDKLRAIVTTGPGGSFGRIVTPDGEFRLTPGEGFDWLVDMTAEAPYLPSIDLHDDMRRVPPRAKSLAVETDTSAAEFQDIVPGVNSVATSKATLPQVVVDLMVVYTNTYAANLGANLQTRLNFLVSSANTMYADSDVAITLRLVHHVGVNYSDAIDAATALNAITPAAGGGTGVFAGIEGLRTQYGADMVAFLRNGSDFGGGGIGWTLDAPLSSGYAGYMYSVTTGCVRGCEWVIIHELGHNMGNMHDRATTSWQDGGTPTPSQGSYPYSFGYYSCTANTLSCNPSVPGGCTAQPECSTPRGGTNNFSDVMAYFHATTTRNFKFSNPAINCAGALGIQVPCGVANVNDTARSMNNNRVALSALRATTVGSGPPDARLSNLSTRMQVLTGNDVLIGGFVIGGSANKTVVVRARGPSLVPFGIANALANPTLQLVRSSDQATIATNDDWVAAANSSAIGASGFAPSDSRESAILVTLQPGAYTAIVSGAGGTTGMAIVEVFTP